VEQEGHAPLLLDLTARHAWGWGHTRQGGRTAPRRAHGVCPPLGGRPPSPRPPRDAPLWQPLPPRAGV